MIKQTVCWTDDMDYEYRGLRGCLIHKVGLGLDYLSFGDMHQLVDRLHNYWTINPTKCLGDILLIDLHYKSGEIPNLIRLYIPLLLDLPNNHCLYFSVLFDYVQGL